MPLLNAKSAVAVRSVVKLNEPSKRAEDVARRKPGSRITHGQLRRGDRDLKIGVQNRCRRFAG